VTSDRWAVSSCWGTDKRQRRVTRQAGPDGRNPNRNAVPKAKAKRENQKNEYEVVREKEGGQRSITVTGHNRLHESSHLSVR
jgi:hypothetical protein